MRPVLEKWQQVVNARVVELVDTQVSEACVERHGSSSLPSGTILNYKELRNSRPRLVSAELLALLAKIWLLARLSQPIKTPMIHSIVGYKY